jgi:hypothetical protein
MYCIYIYIERINKMEKIPLWINFATGFVASATVLLTVYLLK